MKSGKKRLPSPAPGRAKDPDDASEAVPACESNESRGGCAGLAWRLYQTCLDHPAQLVGILLILLVGWQAAGARGAAHQIVLQAILAGLVLLTLLLGRIPLLRQWAGRIVSQGDTARATPLFCDLEARGVDPDLWASAMTLGGERWRIDGFLRVRDEESDSRYVRCENVEQFREFLLCVAGLSTSYGDGELDSATMAITTVDRLTREVAEQAEFHFLFHTSGAEESDVAHVRVSVGYDMPAHKRKPLLDRLTDELLTIPGVSMAKANKAPRDEPPEAIEV